MHRQLGVNEYLFWLHDQAVPLHFAVTAQVVGDLQVDSLRQALIWVQQRHPLLRVRIGLDAAGRPWLLEEAAPIPLRVVQRLSEQQWQQEVEYELAHPFHSNQAPLIRIVLVQAADRSELIVTGHHAIADGMSALYILRDLLQAMGQPGPLPPLPERPAYEDLTAIAHDIQPVPETSPVEWGHRDDTTPVPATDRHFRLLAWSLSPQETATLMRRCQQAQTTVHAAICAAFLLAIAQQGEAQAGPGAQPPEPQDPVTLQCLTPINIRPFLTPPIQEDVGYYFTSSISTHTIFPHVSLWDLAHDLKAPLNQQVSPDQMFAHLPAASAFVATHPGVDQVQELFQDLYRYDILVSNLGQLPIPTQYGHLRLAALYGPSAASHVPEGRFIGVATLGGQMYFSLLYSETTIPPVAIEHLRQAAMDLLVRSSMEPVQRAAAPALRDDSRSVVHVK